MLCFGQKVAAALSRLPPSQSFPNVQYKEIEDNYGIIVVKIHHQFYSKYKETHMIKRYVFVVAQ